MILNRYLNCFKETSLQCFKQTCSIGYYREGDVGMQAEVDMLDRYREGLVRASCLKEDCV